MQVVIKNLNELKSPDKNVRLHGDRQIREYIRSIEKFGQIRPMVIDETNTILAGNGLFQALRQMGRDTADCYVVSGLTAKEKKKLMLADNKIFELGVNDTNTFDELLRELDGDVDIPGYDEELLKVLTASANEADEMIASQGTFSEETIQQMKQVESQPRAQMQMPPAPQRVNGNSEIPAEQFNDERFNCTCPRCGFKFNV